MSVKSGSAAVVHNRKWYHHLYVQVLTAIVIGALLGFFYPSYGAAMKPLGDAFIAAIRMVIAPIIFCTVVHGIASMEDMKKVGRVGLKALIYFEVMTTVALAIGLVIANVWQPGAGVHANLGAIDTKSIQTFTTAAQKTGAVDYLLHIIPVSAIGAFAEGEIIQVLFFAILFAFALSLMGETGKPLLRLIDISLACAVRHHRDRHAGGAAGCVRRDGLHHRPLWHRHAGRTRPAYGECLCDMPDLHLPRAGRRLLGLRL